MKKFLAIFATYVVIFAVVFLTMYAFVEVKDNWDEHRWEVMELTLNVEEGLGNGRTFNTLWDVSGYFCPKDVDRQQYIDMVEKLNGKNACELKRYETIKIYVAWADDAE